MTLEISDFESFHQVVHGSAPFTWQSRLLRQIMEERAWPRVLDLPTGTGKTTCIDIALFALALDAAATDRWCPRRIAMVVDRRIVVDQVAERGRKLLRTLLDEQAGPVVRRVADRLRTLSKEGEDPIGVFTLRGGMPKDDGWTRTPDRPLILASTVDQLGSRLLVQGYGVSKGMKPVHAGLVGNDMLLLLDEVHLSQPFADTLDALDQLRGRFARTSPLKPRFCHAFLSATPGTIRSTPFSLTEGEKARDAPLGMRLHAPKPARLVEVGDRSALESACVEEARALIRKHGVIAVVLNRVTSASAVAGRLRALLTDTADVELLTGRMRPLDRDDVMQSLRPRIMTGRERARVERKLVVVGTQCIEAGADFDFDALVTEAASLDALRQRFGRVDRLGGYREAEGMIIRDTSVKDDPIYGAALARTGAWLKQQAKQTKHVDFGVLALPIPDPEELRHLLAPKPAAPMLLPAYLDLWMQTSPAPAVVPDVALWLHGPGSGPADVQVVWRADLDDDVLASARAARTADIPATIVGAVRPSSLEALSLPFAAAARWLGGERVGDIADVEGAGSDAADPGMARLALRWDGDDSEVISAQELKPGDTVVVPARRGGIRHGCFDALATETVADLAERASLFGRGQPVLRLHGAVLTDLGISVPLDDVDDARSALALTAAGEPVRWRQRWLERLADSKTSIVVEAGASWTVLRGRRIGAAQLRLLSQVDDTTEDGIELTTDEDDSFHAGRSVSLAEHSGDVERFARDYATAAGLPPALIKDLALAGWLHDIGKADRRFQRLLRGGSEVGLFKDPALWAKSGMAPGAKSAHRRAQQRSGYPKGARHEVQSVAMIENQLDDVRARADDLDLVLHLVASHHGYCRPFAPVVVDDAPVEVTLMDHRSRELGGIDFVATSSNHQLHRLDSPLAGRFWRLVERYGWQELCWLEAILRLADHRASEQEQSKGAT
jgi:CRISPR-associated endonuclease/helicase Cas3